MEYVYLRLARRLEELVMGYPASPALPELLREMFTPREAQVALALPTGLPPLGTVDAAAVAAASGMRAEEVEQALEDMAARRMVFTAPTPEGRPGFALLQVGYGMPQAFFWGGGTDARAKKMARRVLDYFTVPVTRQAYGATPTKVFKYSPAALSVDAPMQGVAPNEMMTGIIAGAQKIALAHCPCRVAARLLGRTDCAHSLEVCFKYDEMAEFVIHAGLARPVSKDEALGVLAACEREGLVHMVDNVAGQAKHTCNCCGHYCWNVGIIRRRKIPRDVLMAVYFLRGTDVEECIGCGACAEICPVQAVRMEGDKAVVDEDWCIGCGVCAGVCPSRAVSIFRRLEDEPPADFKDLHQRIARERGLA